MESTEKEITVKLSVDEVSRVLCVLTLHNEDVLKCIKCADQVGSLANVEYWQSILKYQDAIVGKILAALRESQCNV